MRRWLGLLVLLGLLSLPAWAGPYRDDKLGFGIQVPDEWVTRPGDDHFAAYLQGPPTHEGATPPTMNISFEDVAPDMTIEVYDEQIRQQYEKANAQVLFGHRFKIGGKPAARLVALATIHGVKLEVHASYILGNSRVWLLTAVCDPADFDHFEKTFDTIADSFRL
jgi:hypothetical protein